MSALITSNTIRLHNLLPPSSSPSRFPLKSLLFKSSTASYSALRRLCSSTMPVHHLVADPAMDAVQRRLMFEDEFVPLLIPLFINYAIHLKNLLCFFPVLRFV